MIPAPPGVQQAELPVAGLADVVVLPVFAQKVFLFTPMLALLLLLSANQLFASSAADHDDHAGQSQRLPPHANPAELQLFRQSDSDGGRYGYRDKGGEVVIPAGFMMAEPFSQGGIAAVVHDGRWIVIDRYGEPLLQPFVVDNGPDPFSEGLARFVSGGRFGYFDIEGRVVISPRYDYARPFVDGRAEVCLGCVRRIDGEHLSYVGGRWGVVDRSGRWLETPGRPPRAPR